MFRKRRVYRIIEVFDRKIFTKYSTILLILIIRCKKETVLFMFESNNEELCISNTKLYFQP